MIDIDTSYPVRMRRASLAFLLAVGLVLGTGACGSNGSEGSSSDADATEDVGGDGGGSTTDAAPDAGGEATACGEEVFVASVCATVKVSGSTAVDDTAFSPVGGAVSSDGVADCATWAEGVDGDLELPLFLDGLSDGTRFGMESLVTDYSGPGTYGLEQLSGSGSSFTIVVGDLRYQPDPDGQSTATITVEADGSGSLQAGNFLVDNGSGTWSDPIDADISWTCADA